MRKRPDSPISTRADEKTEEKTLQQTASSPQLNHFKKRPKSVGGPQNYQKEDLLAEIKEMKDEHFETIDVTQPQQRPRPRTGVKQRPVAEQFTIWQEFVTTCGTCPDAIAKQQSQMSRAVQHQRFTSARLSVPHERRRRDPHPSSTKQASPVKRCLSSGGTSAMEKT